MSEVRMTCISCGLSPDQIEEYIEAAKEEGITPEQYVVAEEGTYNEFVQDKFYCTECYINEGMPLIEEVSN